MYNNQFGYNPYMQPFNNNFNQPMQNSVVNTQSSTLNPTMSNRQFLNGKLVDSIEVVKATEASLDGNTGYYPLTDGSAIVTKKLLTDGTSKMTIYKPVEGKDASKIQYATIDDLKKSIKEIDLSEIDDLKEEIKELKAEIKKLKKNE